MPSEEAGHRRGNCLVQRLWPESPSPPGFTTSRGRLAGDLARESTRLNRSPCSRSSFDHAHLMPVATFACASNRAGALDWLLGELLVGRMGRIRSGLARYGLPRSVIRLLAEAQSGQIGRTQRVGGENRQARSFKAALCGDFPKERCDGCGRTWMPSNRRSEPRFGSWRSSASGS